MAAGFSCAFEEKFRIFLKKQIACAPLFLRNPTRSVRLKQWARRSLDESLLRETREKTMNKLQPENTITVSCPSGHRLRGGFEMFGKNVKCPRCQAAFVFAPAKANDSDHRAVTDTGVMRILGDMPQVTAPPAKTQTGQHNG